MTKNIWSASAIIIVVLGLFIGTSLSSSNILNFLEKPDRTEKIRTSQSPWSKKNNEYSIQLSYESPGDLEKNLVSISLDSNNNISSFDMSIQTKNDVSIAYQEQFILEVNKTIVGKKVSQVALIDTVAGASLTTQAFKDAFSQF